MKKKLFLLYLLSATIFVSAQNVGIGTTAPQTKLHVFSGASGVTASAFSPLSVESNGHTYINLLSPAANETAVLFGSGTPTNAAIMYNNASTPNGFQFRNNGNITKMVIDNAGNIGVGTVAPSAYGHGGSNRIMEISNPNTGGDIQSQLMLSSNGTSGSVGGITWASQNVPGPEKRLGFIGDVYETSNAARMIFYTRDESGFLAEKFTIRGNGNVGIGTNIPNTPLSFPPTLGKKITLYPGATGDAGFGVAGNRLQIYSDNPNADVAFGYDAAGTFNERFAVKPNGALAVNGNTGTAGQVLQSNGPASSVSWTNSSQYNYFDQAPGSVITLQNIFSVVAGINNQPFQVNFPADLIVTFNGIVTNETLTNIDQNPHIYIKVKTAGGTVVGNMDAYTFLKWTTGFVVFANLTSSFHIKNIAPGSYFLECKAQKYDDGGAGICTLYNSQVRVQVVPQ